MSNNLSAKYYQESKKRLQNKSSLKISKSFYWRIRKVATICALL